MKAERFARMQAVFDRLRDQPEAQQLKLLADQVPDDPALRAEVERLLEIDRELSEEPEIEDRSMPSSIGPYRVIGELGHGGMGTVYKAEQLEPVRRLLAIKVVQRGLATKEVLARFHIERKALAAMNHRHIAKVFDAGATETGEPYFAMELVEGEPLGDYCDRHRLSLPQRLRLFQQICDGVQHAHQKGVVHRDLKPGNVLVATEGSEPVPKIVDFGLAKATDRDFVDVTLMTEHNQVLGTYEYMSPEQAHGDSDLVDARSDIYSLGAMLYELLCGELPFPTEMLRKSGRLEALRLIREQQPQRPSARLQANPDGPTLAALRRTTLPALNKALRADLDWIALKAMAKEPERRYGAASLLAADVQRHLDFEPVLATPPSTGYRIRKFTQRYRVQCIAAGAVTVALGCGAVGVWTGFAAELAAEQAQNERNRVFEDAALLEEAERRAATLYPAWPDRVGAFQGWLETYGQPLARRLPILREDLDRMRRTAAVRGSDPEADAWDDTQRKYLCSVLATEDAEARRKELALQIRRLETAAEIRQYEFADASQALLHATLTRLVHDLERFTSPEGQTARVTARLEQATSVARRTLEEPRAAWAEAISAIASSDGVTASTLYQNLVLSPQVGLVPLGADPESHLWEFVHLASGTPGREVPVRDAQTERLVVTEDTGVVFVLLPGGTLHTEDPEPPHDPISVPVEPFFLSKYELTQGQLLRLETRSTQDVAAHELTLAAVWLSWFDAHNLLATEKWMLPTQVELEYGCRGGTSTPWWTGADPESLVGKESPRNADAILPVGSLMPNPFGLFDTLGNAYEWCRDEETLHTLLGHDAQDSQPLPELDLLVFRHGSLDLDPTNEDNPTNRYSRSFGRMSPSTRHSATGVRPMRPLLP